MSLANLSNILKIFGGKEPNESERQQLFKEALMMTLSRASSSDTDTNPVEVETVRDIVERETGESLSAADVRVAAHSELYESAPLDQYLGRVTKKLLPEERARILVCLAEVIKSDVRVSPREVAFFNWVAKALHVTPAEIVGLHEEA